MFYVIILNGETNNEEEMYYGNNFAGFARNVGQ